MNEKYFVAEINGKFLCNKLGPSGRNYEWTLTSDIKESYKYAYNETKLDIPECVVLRDNNIEQDVKLTTNDIRILELSVFYVLKSL